MLKLTYIPSMLVGLRFAIAPLLLLDALDRQTGNWFILGYVIAVLSDIFDGIIARRLGVSTVKLRQADGWADMVLYGCIALSIWFVYPQVFIDFKVPLLLSVFAQVCLDVISLIKFQKLPSFHGYTAKAWGLGLLVATIGLFGFNYTNTLWLAISLCWINSVEEIIMTLILPEWQCDVWNIFAAIDLRNKLMISQAVTNISHENQQ
jgi:phosphatidylglycerophosphate synthase